MVAGLASQCLKGWMIQDTGFTHKRRPRDIFLGLGGSCQLPKGDTPPKLTVGERRVEWDIVSDPRLSHNHPSAKIQSDFLHSSYFIPRVDFDLPKADAQTRWLAGWTCPAYKLCPCLGQRILHPFPTAQMAIRKFETSHLISNCRPLDCREMLFLCVCFVVVEWSLSASFTKLRPTTQDSTFIKPLI